MCAFSAGFAYVSVVRITLPATPPPPSFPSPTFMCDANDASRRAQNGSDGTLTPSFYGDDAEQQPLLPNKRKPTPLPKKQLAIICLCRLAEPIA